MIREHLKSSSAILAACLPLWLACAVPAEARSNCGRETVVQRRETPDRLAARCGVDEEALRAVNPDVDWQDLRAGMRVAMPDDRRAGPGRDMAPPSAGAPVYRVERGDTVESVARALGLSVDALLGTSPGLSDRDLVPGREINRRGFQDDDAPPPPPPRGGDIDISVADRRVEPGDVTVVDLDGLPPRVPIMLRAGPEGRRPIVEARGRADRDGRASVDLQIPERARPGENWVVALVGPDRRPIATTRLRIADGGPRGGRGTEVTGLLTREGVECPALRSDDGTLFTLSGPLQGFRAGDMVTVTGRPTRMSNCQQGVTLEIDDIRQARR